MNRAKILGTGHFLPPKVVTNEELASKIGVSASWIEEMTGIKERRYAEIGLFQSDIAYEAADRAINDAGLKPEDLDCIMVGATVPQGAFPGIACFLQKKLNLSKAPFIPCFDLRQQEAGFIYALDLAHGFIKRGRFKCILVIGIDIASRVLEWSDRGRDVTPFFGDGAGAVVLGATEEERSDLIASEVHTDGRHLKLLWYRLIDMGCKPFVPIDTNHPEDTRFMYLFFEAEPFMNLAKETLSAFVPDFLSRIGYSIHDIKRVILQQISKKTNDAIVENLGIQTKTEYNLESVGNTLSASVPILLDQAIKAKRIERGDLVLLVTFGGSITWGATLLRY